MSNVDVARAFSEHRFKDAYPHIAPDVRWNVVGAGILPGKQVLMRNCGAILDELDGIDVQFRRFRIVSDEDTVVVDSIAHYDGDDASTVSACDIYEFSDGIVTAITSYSVELDPVTPA